MEKIICSKCTCNQIVKNGFTKGSQRYKCKACGFNFTIERRGRGKPESQKRMALHMYLEGLGFRSIGRILKVSNVSVLKWIRSFGEKIKELRQKAKPEEVKVIELDEMWHYVQKKEKHCGYGLLMTETEEGQSVSSVVVVRMSQD